MGWARGHSKRSPYVVKRRRARREKTVVGNVGRDTLGAGGAEEKEKECEGKKGKKKKTRKEEKKRRREEKKKRPASLKDTVVYETSSRADGWQHNTFRRRTWSPIRARNQQHGRRAATYNAALQRMPRGLLAVATEQDAQGFLEVFNRWAGGRPSFYSFPRTSCGSTHLTRIVWQRTPSRALCFSTRSGWRGKRRSGLG